MNSFHFCAHACLTILRDCLPNFFCFVFFSKKKNSLPFSFWWQKIGRFTGQTGLCSTEFENQISTVGFPGFQAYS
jgi:hypothetical protein